MAPNALASYYTYQPLSPPMLHWPDSRLGCGDQASALPADVASTMDCYIISVKQLVQPMSLDFLKFCRASPRITVPTSSRAPA